MPYLCTRKSNGAIAQLVEQRTENPCVPGSIPGGTTKRDLQRSLFCFTWTSLFIPKEFRDAAQIKAYPFVPGRTCKAQQVLCRGSRHDGWHRPFPQPPRRHA